MTASGQLWSIQYLRAFAALVVLAYHVTWHFKCSQYVYMAAVDLFFIISGFVIWISTSGRGMTVKEYMWRRFMRVVPLYWVVTLASCLLYLCNRHWARGEEVTWPYLGLSLAFWPYFRSTGAVAPIVAPGWTLNLEMLFYLLFAMALPQRNEWRRVAAVALALAGIVLQGVWMGRDYPPLYAWSRPVIMEFAAGLCLGYAYLRGWLKPGSHGWWLVALAMVLFMLQVNQPRPYGVWRLLYFGVPNLLLAGGLLMLERGGRLPRWRFFAHLGDASYSMYLWHVQLMYVLLLCCDLLRLPREWWLMLPLWLVLVLAALPAYRYIERPLLQRLRRIRNNAV